MRVIRMTLALLAWIIIEIPTTLFVVFVMIKAFVEGLGKKGRVKETQSVPSTQSVQAQAQRKEELV